MGYTDFLFRTVVASQATSKTGKWDKLYYWIA